MDKYKLLNKIVFKVIGTAEKFLIPLTTNTLDKPINAFLDRFGKLIAIADQLFIGEECYLVIQEQYAEKLLLHLQQYIRLSNAKIQFTPLKAVHVFPEGNKKSIGSPIIPQAIGYISLIENLEQLKQLKSFKELSDEEYEKIRIENNIPLQGIDFTNEMFLEVNIPEAISFTKGCYLGQEIIARVHNKSKPVRVLTRILYQQLPENNIVTSHGKEIGKITSSCYSEKLKGHLCFAMIKNQDAEIDNGKILK